MLPTVWYSQSEGGWPSDKGEMLPKLSWPPPLLSRRMLTAAPLGLSMLARRRPSEDNRGRWAGEPAGEPAPPGCCCWRIISSLAEEESRRVLGDGLCSALLRERNMPPDGELENCACNKKEAQESKRIEKEGKKKERRGREKRATKKNKFFF